jgi:hypothetical protein
MTEENFRARLVDLGIKLDGRAFAAAFTAAQELRLQAARLETYVAPPK